MVRVGRDSVTVDIGYKSEGQIPIHEFIDRDGKVTCRRATTSTSTSRRPTASTAASCCRARRRAAGQVWRDIEEAFQSDGAVEGTIVGKVKGGLKVDIGVRRVPARLARRPAAGAQPRSLHRPARPLRDPQVQPRRAATSWSRGARCSSASATQLKEETLKVLEEGVILEGIVKNITDYGAFVDLGGIDGLLHVTDMSWGRVAHPSDVVNVGDRVKVVVLKYDPERERVSLGMKQIMPDPVERASRDRYPIGARVHGKVVEPHRLRRVRRARARHRGPGARLRDVVDEARDASVEGARGRARRSTSMVLDVDAGNRRISLGLKQAEPNPWEMVRINHPIGSHIKGKVKNITDFGVFVGVDEGIDGLVHISDLHWTKKVKHPSELFKKGDEVEAVVLGIDVDNERISLGVKQLTEDPWATDAAALPGRAAACRARSPASPTSASSSSSRRASRA